MFTHLGHTADEIAQTLKSLGITGVRNTVRTLNPIVRYAKMHRPDAFSMDVISGRTLRIVLPTSQTIELPLSEAVLAFLDAFNRGAYPELEGTGQT